MSHFDILNQSSGNISSIKLQFIANLELFNLKNESSQKFISYCFADSAQWNLFSTGLWSTTITKFI